MSKKSAFKKDFYVILSKAILDLSITKGAKVVFGALINFATMSKTGKAYPRTKTIAEKVGLSIRSTQRYLQELIMRKLIKIEWRGRHRVYQIDVKYLEDDDAKAIISSDVISRTDLSPSYKISQGIHTALSKNNDIGGHVWNTMENMAEYMGVSVSTAYRHLHKLVDAQTLERDSNNIMLIRAIDLYTRNDRNKIEAEIAKRKRMIEEMKAAMASGELPHISDEQERMLDNAYRSMR